MIYLSHYNNVYHCPIPVSAPAAYYMTGTADGKNIEWHLSSPFVFASPQHIGGSRDATTIYNFEIASLYLSLLFMYRQRCLHPCRQQTGQVLRQRVQSSPETQV